MRDARRDIGGAPGFVAGCGLIALLLAAALFASWPRLAATGFLRSCPQPLCDFHLYYYPMGEAVFTTALPVTGFLYSPFVAILLAAFPPVGARAASALWVAFHLASLALYLGLFRSLVPARPLLHFAFTAVALSSFPLLFNLWAGQFSVFIVVLLLGALSLYERGHRTTPSGLIGLATSVKFFPALFVAPFAARRDGRLVALALAGCAACLVLVPAVLLGPGETAGFYRALAAAFRDAGWVAANPHSQFLPHVVIRLFAGIGLDVAAALPALSVVSYGVAAANLVLVVLVQRARLPEANLWSFQIVFLTIPFVLKTSWPHDFVFLPFTQILLAGRLNENGRFAALGILVAPSIVLSNIAFFALLGHFTAYGSLGCLFWANLLLLIAVYRELLPSARRPASP